MMYKSISNNPSKRTSISYPWSYWDGAFNAEELDKVCKYFTEQGVERGTTVGKKDPITDEVQQKPNEDVDFTEEECNNAKADTLLCKLWSICYNQHIHDIHIRLKDPILLTESSIIFKGDTIPQEDRIYDKQKLL